MYLSRRATHQVCMKEPMNKKNPQPAGQNDIAEPDYRLIFERSPVPLLVLHPDLTIVAATDGYLTATKRNRSELLGLHIFKAFPDNPHDESATGVSRLEKSLLTVLKEKQPHSMPVQKYDIPVPGSEGGGFEVRYWNPQNVPVLAPDGEVRYIIHRVDDVTELVLTRQKQTEQQIENTDLRESNRDMAVAIMRNNAEIEKRNVLLQQANGELTEKTEELKRSNQELAHFASTASHDIQAPFRIVGNYLGMIEEKLRQQNLFDDFTGHFRRIFVARDRIATLLDDLLTFAMVSKDDHFTEPVDIGKLISEVLLNLEAAINESNAVVDVQRDLPTVTGEYIQLSQVFQNLIANAIKYNRNKPKIVVFCKKRSHDWLFGVRDNGMGIAPDYHRKVFDVFQRLNSRDEFPGTGLGLAICKRVVEHHGGFIWVESEPGHGSTFYFTLPQ